MSRLFLALWIGSMVSPAFAQIEVHIENLLPKNSKVAYALFRTAEGFPEHKEKAWRRGFWDVTAEPSGQAKFVLTEVPPGTYALLLYQDLNDNQKLDKNFLGIPREPTGASQNPKGRLGPPVFEECVFSFEKSEHRLSIKMVK